MDALAALAILGSGIISTAGQIYSNKKNLDYQDKVNQTNWEIAALNNATQIEMANSAHQREVADLRAAGLNPILSAGGSGAGMPSLTSARLDAAQIQNPVSGIANSAKELAHYVSKSYDLQTDQQRADVDATKLDNNIRRNDQYASDLDALRSKLHAEALTDLGFSYYIDDDGERRYYPDKYSQYYKKYKEGLLEAAKLEASKYTRANYESVLQGINSAAGVVRAFTGGKPKAGKALKKLPAPKRVRQKLGPSGNPDNPDFE